MNGEENKVDDTLQIVKRLDDTPDLVDIMIDIEDYLDRNDLYAFKHWIDGQLIDGPRIFPYWIKVGFKWDANKMPDPAGAARLLPHGTKIAFKKTKQNVSQPVKSESDYKPGTHKPKIKAETVWVVEMLIPRRFVEDINKEVMDLYDEKVDVETAQQANTDGNTEANSTEQGGGNVGGDTGDALGGNDTGFDNAQP